jgi:hypothetical protein
MFTYTFVISINLTPNSLELKFGCKNEFCALLNHGVKFFDFVFGIA